MKKPKSNIIIEALHTGNAFSLSDITAYLSKVYGEDVKSANVSPVLTKLCDNKKSEIGYFIQKRKKPGQANEYKLVDEACAMLEEELIHLSLHRIKNRFTLTDAVQKYPDLQKYVDKFSSSDDAEAALGEGKVQPNPQFDQEQELRRLVREVVKSGVTIDVTVNIRIV